MPKLDRIHDAVRNALKNDGWTITADSYTITYEEITVFADLAAERPLAAEREGRGIVVEAKSFSGPSPVHDLEVAPGQYALYLGLLEMTAPDRELFLAVGLETGSDLFQQKAVQLVGSALRTVSIPRRQTPLQAHAVMR